MDDLAKNELWTNIEDGVFCFQQELDLFRDTFFEEDGSIKQKVYFSERKDRNREYSWCGSKVIGNSLFAPELETFEGRTYLGVDYQGGFDREIIIHQDRKNKVDVTNMSQEEILELTKEFLQMSNAEILEKYGPFNGSLQDMALRLELLCYDEIVKFFRETENLAPTYRSAVADPHHGLRLKTPNGHSIVIGHLMHDHSRVSIIDESVNNIPICEIELQNDSAKTLDDAGLKLITNGRSLRKAETPLEKRILQTVSDLVDKSVKKESEEKKVAEHIESAVKRFEELFLNDQAIESAIEWAERLKPEWYIPDPIGIKNWAHIEFKEEHQIGIEMPHGNNLFGLNCHVIRDENGELKYTLTVNEGVFQPTKTYFSAELIRNGRSIFGGELRRFGGSTLPYIPNEMKFEAVRCEEVDTLTGEVDYVFKKPTCIEMSRDEVIQNVRDFFSMTNEEVFRRYNIKGQHPEEMISMIMLDAIYEEDQEQGICGDFEYVVMQSRIGYKNKNGERYEFRYRDSGECVELKTKDGEINVNFSRNGKAVNFEGITITGIDIKGDSEKFTRIRERLESVFATSFEHTAEQIGTATAEVSIEEVNTIMRDVMSDAQNQRVSREDVPSIGE